MDGGVFADGADELGVCGLLAYLVGLGIDGLHGCRSCGRAVDFVAEQRVGERAFGSVYLYLVRAGEGRFSREVVRCGRATCKVGGDGYRIRHGCAGGFPFPTASVVAVAGFGDERGCGADPPVEDFDPHAHREHMQSADVRIAPPIVCIPIRRRCHADGADVMNIADIVLFVQEADHRPVALESGQGRVQAGYRAGGIGGGAHLLRFLQVSRHARLA